MSETRHRHSTRTYQGRVGTDSSGVWVVVYDVDHSGKVNHKLVGGFEVAQPDNNKIYDIKFHILTATQIVDWLVRSSNTNSKYANPQEYIISRGASTRGEFTVDINHTGKLFFAFSNRFSNWTMKDVTITITEQWDEMLLSLDFVATVPPQDDSLRNEAARILSASKSSLKIISPYVDMTFVKILLQKQSENIAVQIITRPDGEIKGKEKESALKFINQIVRANHKVNAYVHSRIIIRDNEEALISSADLTQDSLLGQFNAGVILNDPNVIRKLLSYFDTVWQTS